MTSNELGIQREFDLANNIHIDAGDGDVEVMVRDPKDDEDPKFKFSYTPSLALSDYPFSSTAMGEDTDMLMRSVVVTPVVPGRSGILRLVVPQLRYDSGPAYQEGLVSRLTILAGKISISGTGIAWRDGTETPRTLDIINATARSGRLLIMALNASEIRARSKAERYLTDGNIILDSVRADTVRANADAGVIHVLDGRVDSWRRKDIDEGGWELQAPRGVTDPDAVVIGNRGQLTIIKDSVPEVRKGANVPA